VIVVTGAAKRIGRVIALRLASEGARVAIHYNNSEAEALKTAQNAETLRFIGQICAKSAKLRRYLNVSPAITDVSTGW